MIYYYILNMFNSCINEIVKKIIICNNKLKKVIKKLLKY